MLAPTQRSLLLHVLVASAITFYNKRTEAVIAEGSDSRPISASNVTTLSPRRYLWEASDAEVDYDAVEAFEDVGAPSRADEPEEANTVRPTERGKAIDLHWLAAFRACDNASSSWASEEQEQEQETQAQELIDMLSCSDSDSNSDSEHKRTLPLECSLVSPDGVRCVCTTLYGIRIRTSDSSPNVFHSFLLQERDATVENVLVGAKRCLPDWMTLDVVLYNASLAAHDEVNWLTALARSWIAQSRISTFDVPPGSSFQRVDALMLNASTCANHVWFARWQLQLRVHSAPFETDLGLLLRFVRASMSASLASTSVKYKLLRICVIPERRADSDADAEYEENVDPASSEGLYATLYCPDVQLLDVPQTAGFEVASLCDATDADADETAEYDALTTPNAIVLEEEPDSLEAESIAATELLQDVSVTTQGSWVTSDGSTAAVAADANVAKLSSDAALDAFRLPTALPSWLLATIILACSFGFGSLSALVTCYFLRQRRKNKGSYKIRLFNPKLQPESLSRSAVSFKVPLVAPAAVGVNTFVSLDEPLVHDYSAGPPPREFFA